MSKKKILTIWCIGTVIFATLVFLSVSFFMQTIVSVLAPQFMKYGGKVGPTLFHTETVDQATKGAVLKIRGLLSDTSEKYSAEDEFVEGEELGLADKLLGDVEMTHVYRFCSVDGEPTALASGCWSGVYRYDPAALEEGDLLNRMENKTSFAMFDVEKAINQGYGAELQEAIRADKEVCIYTDKFAVKGLELIPMHVVMLKDGNIIKEYTPNAESDIPDGFEVICENDVWIYNRLYNSVGETITGIDLSNMKEIERLRGIAEKTADSIDFENPAHNMENDYYQKITTTLFNTTAVSYGVVPGNDDAGLYALVTTYSMSNLNIMLYLEAVTLGLWTGVYAIIIFAFRKRKKVH